MKVKMEAESHRQEEELVQRLEKEKREALDSLKREHLLLTQAIQERSCKKEAEQRKFLKVSVERHMEMLRNQCDEWNQEKIKLNQSHKTAIRYI